MVFFQSLFWLDVVFLCVFQLSVWLLWVFLGLGLAIVTACFLSSDHFGNSSLIFYFWLIVDVRATFHAPRLILRDPEVNNRVKLLVAVRGFEPMTLRELELVTIG